MSGARGQALVRLVPRPWVPRVEPALGSLRPHAGAGGGVSEQALKRLLTMLAVLFGVYGFAFALLLAFDWLLPWD